MSETYQFKLPLLEAAQAQKHVTVNEALAKLDAFAQLRVQSRSQAVPAVPVDGQSYIVPAGAGGAWVGQDTAIALFGNGGWIFAPAQDGWSAWVLDEGSDLRFDGVSWDYSALSVDENLGSIVVQTIEFDHIITPGASNQTSAFIPTDTVVYGVSGRVIQAISGPPAFRIGIETSQSRYGTALNTALNSSHIRATSKPQAYYEDTPLRIAQEGGLDFIDGAVRICIHLAIMTPPAAV